MQNLNKKSNVLIQGTLFDEVKSDITTLPVNLQFKSNTTFKEKSFKKPISPKSIIDKTGFCLNRCSDKELINVYHYAKFGNMLLRYPSYRYFNWSSNEQLYINQRCGIDAIKRILVELNDRCLLEDADNNYHIDFNEIKLFIAKKAR
jgi:hypothetical protein